MPTWLVVLLCFVGAAVVGGLWLYFKIKQWLAQAVVFTAKKAVGAALQGAADNFASEDIRGRLLGFKQELDQLPAAGLFTAKTVALVAARIIGELVKLGIEISDARKAHEEQNKPVTVEVIDVTAPQSLPAAPLALPAPAPAVEEPTNSTPEATLEAFRAEWVMRKKFSGVLDAWLSPDKAFIVYKIEPKGDMLDRPDVPPVYRNLPTMITLFDREREPND